MSRGAGLSAAGVAGAAAATALVLLRRVKVEGRSMAPALLPGDRLLVLRRRRPPPVGALVAVKDPREPDRVLVKRLAAVTDRGLVVHGDFPAASTDSRQFGPLPACLLVGEVVYRYAPAERSGPLHHRVGGATGAP